MVEVRRMFFLAPERDNTSKPMAVRVALRRKLLREEEFLWLGFFIRDPLFLIPADGAGQVRNTKESNIF